MLALLAACDPGPDNGGELAASPAVEPPVPVASGNRSPQGDAAVEEPGGLIEEDPAEEKGARSVLVQWARALERKDFAAADALIAEGGSTGIDYSEFLGAFRTITVAAPVGRVEGAAGSLYYASTVTVTGTRADGSRAKLQGPVVLRRVNDVPGAAPEQLRWHIQSAELKPVT